MNLKYQILLLLTGLLLIFASCSEESTSPDYKLGYAPESGQMAAPSDDPAAVQDNNALWKRGSNNGGGKGKKNNDPFVKTFRISNADDVDPLFQFSLSESGKLILLESDPVSDGGTDFFGAWADPFMLVNNTVDFTTGLIRTVYTLNKVSDSKFDVSATRFQMSAFTNIILDSTTTHPGEYTLLSN